MSDEIRRVVTPLHGVAQQVGNTALATLDESDTSGVLTSSVSGFPQGQIAFRPLSIIEQTKSTHPMLKTRQLAILQQVEGQAVNQVARQIGFQITEIDTKTVLSNDERT